LLRIRELNKEPTQLELATCIKEHYPKLVLAIQQIKGLIASQALVNLKGNSNSDGDGDGNSDIEVRIITTIRTRSLIPDYKDLSPPPPVLIDSFNVESDIGSIDSI
jgi:hypothetical protein